MQIILEVPESLEFTNKLLESSIKCIWNTIIGCALMGDIDNMEYLTNSAANIAAENIKICKRELSK